MNALLTRIPAQGYKTLAGVALVVVAGVLRKYHLVDQGTFDLMQASGIGLIGLGLKSGQARSEEKLDQAAQLAAQGTAPEVVLALKRDAADRQGRQLKVTAKQVTDSANQIEGER